MKRILSLLTLLAVLVSALISCKDVNESYEKLDAYITSKTTAQDGVHVLVIGTGTAGDAEYKRIARRSADEIVLAVEVSEEDEDSGRALRSFTLVITRGSYDAYKWTYSSAISGGTMSGVIIPDEYKRASAGLGYSTSNTSDEYEINSMSALAKGLCNYLLDNLASDLLALELTAEDFGFEDFES